MFRRRFLGELTRGQIIKNAVVGGVLIGVLLGVWFGYPAVLNLITGTRGGYETHEPDIWTPDDEPYVLTEISFNDTFNPPPGFEFDDYARDFWSDHFNAGDTEVDSSFSDFNSSNWNMPLFYYNDVGDYSPVIEYMRHNCYDTLNDDGTGWSRNSQLSYTLGSENRYYTPFDWSREIKININTNASVDLRLPFFPNKPIYYNGSLRLTDIGGEPGNVQYLPDGDTLSIEYRNDLVVGAANQLPPDTVANLTYNVDIDWMADPSFQDSYKYGSMPSVVPYGNIPAPLVNYLQIPLVDPGTRELGPYLATHPNFATAYYNILIGNNLDKQSNETWVILHAIDEYIRSNYDLFATYPERPGAGVDMVEWFLQRPKTSYPNAGGSTYDFAAAFTMLARAFNIPTRLVIGYYDWDFDGEVTPANIYAWCEAYLPENSTTGQWINYDFPVSYNSSSFIPPISEGIIISYPFDGETINYLTGIPLQLVMQNGSEIVNASYSIDSGPYIDVTSYVVNNSPYYYVDTTFDVTTDGIHEIFAFMNLSSGLSFQAPPVSFIINRELGGFITLDLPVNNTVQQLSNTFPLDYSFVNSTPVTGAVLRIFYSNGTQYGTDLPTSTSTFYSGTFNVNDHGTYYLGVYVFTDGGGFNSTADLGPVWFTYGKPEHITIIEPFNASITTYYSRTGIPLLVEYYNESSLLDFGYSIDGGTYTPFTPNGTFSVASDGLHTVRVRGYLEDPGQYIYSVPVTFNVFQDSVLVSILSPQNATLNNTVINTNTATIQVEIQNTTDVTAVSYSIDNGANVSTSYTAINGTVISFVGNNGPHTIQVFVQTVGSFPDFHASQVRHFTVDYEIGIVSIQEPFDIGAYTYTYRSNIALNFTLFNNGLIVSTTYRVSGPSPIDWTDITGFTSALFNLTQNGDYTLYLSVHTTRGYINQTRMFRVLQQDILVCTVNWSTFLPAAVPDTSTLVLNAFVGYINGTPHVAKTVRFIIFPENIVYTNLTNTFGYCSRVLLPADLTAMQTGVHQVRVEAEFGPSPDVYNFTYFAIDRATTLSINTVTPSSGGNHYFTRYWNSSLSGTLFTVSGVLRDGASNPLADAFIEVNLDTGTWGHNLRFTAVRVKTTATGTFSWSGRVDAGVTEGLHQLRPSFVGIVNKHGINFTFSTAISWNTRDINVTVATTVTTGLSQLVVEVFDTITISGYLRYDNGTALVGKTVNITITFYIGTNIQGVWNLAATTDINGYYTLDHVVTVGSDLIVVDANYYSGNPLYTNASATVTN